MKEEIFKIKSNKEIASNVFKLILQGNTKSIKNSGQFVNIKIPSFYLRRPISICDYDNKTLTLIYKILGKGTLYLSKLKSGELNLLLPLGNGYSIIKKSKYPLLIGGGVGIPPLFNLAKRLIKENKKVTVILGFNKKEEVFYESEFKKIGAHVIVTTIDGSYGKKGLVTDYINKIKYDYFYTCGPIVMLKNVFKLTNTNGEFSLEERMGCGFGVCMGCSINTKNGPKRVCKEGPVFKKEDLLWQIQK